MPLVSYAQNAEDVVLARVFEDVQHGFYVDVGAGHPVVDSVTKHFYDRGWRGLNIEPLSEELELLQRDRPGDVNLGVALSNRVGDMPFFAGPPENRGNSTLEPALASMYRQLGQDFEERMVPVATLQSVLERHVDREIDFLKIDVEGHEGRVLGGVDLRVWRPRLMVVEATLPNSRVGSHEAWEPALVRDGYVLRLFDGLNRFYVRNEDLDRLGPALAAPANVLDNYVPFRFRSELDDAAARGRALQAELHAAQDAATDLRDEVARVAQAAEAARRVAATEALRRVVAEKAASDAAREVRALQGTATFRYTRALRRFYGAALRRRRAP